MRIFLEPLVIATLVCTLVLLGAAGFHLYWGFGGRVGYAAALPQHPGGERVFTPSAGGAIAVGVLLLAAAALTALLGTLAMQRASGAGPAPLALRCVAGAMALVFTLRAVGPFRYAGWFKAVRDTYFARYDTWLYCPLCLVLGIGLGWLVWTAS